MRNAKYSTQLIDGLTSDIPMFQQQLMPKEA
jgi:hypothetical protein